MQIFHRSTNTIAKVSIFGAVAFLAVLLWLWSTLLRSAYATGQGVIQKQPVPFSHDHHVAGLGIDCRYCHTTVENSAFAGIPPTETCMNCHRQIWTDADLLEPVRESYRSGTPIVWNRVNDLPDYVYFNHAIHVAKGIGCAECHGQVDEMPLMRQTASLQMEWCLDCHRDPGKRLRPRAEVFNMKWRPPADFEAMQARLVREYDVKSLTSCSVCHR
ncbi:MAG TPA: cytochrome c3 family protein [Thermoanaerobaculia bacterium]